MGNLRSVTRAWEEAGAEARLITAPEELPEADALVFPGQGAIGDCMRLLRETGFDRVIREWIAADRPFFGICLGLQALFDYSEEGGVEGLGVFAGEVRRFRVAPPLKIPHMGWNAVTHDGRDPLAEGIVSGRDQFYFVHSYYAAPREREGVLFEADYGGTFVAGVRRGRCYATQFHPEKSQAKGLRLYANFLRTL